MLDIINIVKSATREIANNFNVADFSKELESRLEKMEQNQYTIDRFEGEFAVCENRETKQMKNIKRDELPKDAVEGSIIELKDGKFTMNKEENEEVADRIKQKMDDLWNN